MAKMHKDYTIADMLRLGGAWVKTYKDLDSLRQIAGMLAMMDKATTIVTVEPFMLEDKSIESDPDKIRAICLSLDGGAHVPSAPTKISSIDRRALKHNLGNISEEISSCINRAEELKHELNDCYSKIKSTAMLSIAALNTEINPSEVCTFEYIGSTKNGNALFVQSVPTNMSRVDPDGNIHQRCLGRYAVLVSFNHSGSISCTVVASVDGLKGSTYIHPNVGTKGNICFGDGNAAAATLQSKGDIVGLLKLIDSVLRTSQYGSPYAHLSAFNDASRAKVVANEGITEDVMNMLLPLATCTGEVEIYSSTIVALPCEDIVDMLDMNGEPTVTLRDTEIPEVVYVLDQTLIKYAARSLFTIATKKPMPTAGAWLYRSGAYAINGVLYGERNEYEEPERLDTYTVNSNTTAIVNGLLVVDDEVCTAVAKIVAGVTVGLFVRTAFGIKRVGSADKIAEFIPTRLAEELQESRHQRLIDTGVGLLLASGDRQTVNIVNNERVTDVVEGTENMPAYAI